MERDLFWPLFSEQEWQTIVSQKIVYYRKEAGLTQKKLSIRSGISVGTIQRIEQGNDTILPALSTLLRLMNALEHNIGDLFS